MCNGVFVDGAKPREVHQPYSGTVIGNNIILDGLVLRLTQDNAVSGVPVYCIPGNVPRRDCGPAEFRGAHIGNYSVSKVLGDNVILDVTSSGDHQYSAIPFFRRHVVNHGISLKNIPGAVNQAPKHSVEAGSVAG